MRDRGKTLASLACLVAVVAGLALGAAGGVAAADVEIANETVSVNNDTRSVYAEVDATNNTADANVTVEFVPISDGNESAPITRNLTVGAGNTTLEEYEQVNATEYDSYRVVVTADNSTNTTATVGTLQEVSGGSGGGFSLKGASNTQILGVVVVALGVIGYIKRE